MRGRKEYGRGRKVDAGSEGGRVGGNLHAAVNANARDTEDKCTA